MTQPRLPDVDQQSWNTFSGERWFKQTEDRINSIANMPGSAFLESSSSRIASLGALPMPVPIPAPPRIPAPEPAPAPAPQPTLPQPTPLPEPAPGLTPAPTTAAPPTPAPGLPIQPTQPTEPTQPLPPPTVVKPPPPTLPQGREVPDVAGSDTQQRAPSGSIYTPTAPQQKTGPFGGAANGPFATTTPTQTTTQVKPQQSLGASGSIPASINVAINQGPTITRDQAIAALRGTPLQDIAGQIWDLGVKYNVDPAFALSVAKNESAYGDPSVAPGQARNNNIWDISNAAYGGTAVPGSRWGQYATKLDGAEAFYKLITQEYYPNGQTSVGSVMWGPDGSQKHAYAPLSENSADYPTRLVNTMTGYGSTASPTTTTSPTTTQQQTTGPDLAPNWKTQFDFGATYTGDYRTGTPHRGVDLVPSNGKGIGTEVDAFAPGTVTNVFRDPGGAGGLIVYVQDADGLTHAYMHLNDATVKIGDVVQRGTPIAHMGESGTEGSPHLHYEVRKNASNGDPLNALIDPRPYEQGTKQPGGATTAVMTPDEQLDQQRQVATAALNPKKQQPVGVSPPTPKVTIPQPQLRVQPPEIGQTADVARQDQSPWQELGNTISSAVQRAVSGVLGGMGPPGGPPGGDNGQRDRDQQQQDLQAQQQAHDVRSESARMIDELFANPYTREPDALSQATGLYRSPPKDMKEAWERAVADIQRRGVPFPGPGGSLAFLQPGRSFRELFDPAYMQHGPDAAVFEDILNAVPRILGGGGGLEGEAGKDLVNPIRAAAADAAEGTRASASSFYDAASRAAEAAAPTPSSSAAGGIQRSGLQSAWDALVRNFFDQNTDLGNIQKDLARRTGPLADDQRVADLARFDPTHQAESVLEHDLSPPLTRMSQQELDDFDKFVELHTDRSAAEGMAKKAERDVLNGGIADSTTRRAAEADKALEEAQLEHAQALADQRAIDLGVHKTRDSISLDAAGQRVRDAEQAVADARDNAAAAAGAKRYDEVMRGPRGELVRPHESRDLAIAESDARRANAAYERLAARDASVPIAERGQNNAVRRAYEKRLQSLARQVAYAEDRVTRMRSEMGLTTAARESNVTAQAESAAAKARMTLSDEAKDLLKKVDDGGMPTRVTSNLKRIADEHGIPVTKDTTPDDVIAELRKIRRNPPGTPELAAAQVRLRYEQANLDRLNKAKSEGQRILDETLARAWRKRDEAQRDVDQATADLPEAARAQGWAQLTGRVSRDPYTGAEIHYDDVINRLRELEDKYKDTPTWDKFSQGYRALHDLRVRQLNEKVEGGVMTPETRDALLDTYDFHTPTNILDYAEGPTEGMRGGRRSSFGVSGNGLQRYTPEGSSLEHESHLGATIRDTYQHYNTLARNRKTRALVDADNGAFKRIANTVDEYNAAGGKSGPLLEPDYKPKTGRGEVPVSVMVDGKPQRYITDNPVLVEALRSNSLGTDNKWLNYLKMPANLVRETAIQRNPKFLPVNMLRDVASTVLKEMTYGGPTIGGMDDAGRWAWDFRPQRGLGSTALNWGPAVMTAALTDPRVNPSADPNDPDRAKKIAAALALGMGTRAGLNTNLGMGSSTMRRFATVFLDNMAGLGSGRMTGEGVRALSEAGGRVGQSDLFRGGGADATAEALRRLSRPNAFSIRNGGDLKQLMDDVGVMGWMGAWSKNIGKRLENIPRQVSFEQAKARGESDLQAAMRARDSSVDFDRGGRLTRVVNQYIPFTNVGFQAPAQLKRLIQENPLGALYAGMTLLGAPAAAAEAWNRSDPQRAKDYEDDPNYLTNQGIDIMMPGDQPTDPNGNRTPQKIHLVIPNEFMPFVTAGREAYKRIAGEDPTSGGDLAKTLLGELSPTGYGSSIGSTAGSLLPKPFDTLLQLQLNHDLFRDSTIANQYSDESASNLGKTLAPILEHIVNQFPGGETARIRPSHVDFVIKDVLNGAGQQGLEATDALSGREPRPGDAGNIPLVGSLASRFVRTTGGQSWEDVRRPENMMASDIRKTLRSYGDYYEPSPVDDQIEKVPLTREEQVDYQQKVNQYFDQYMRKVMDRPVFSRSSEARDALRRDAMDAAREKAGSEVLRSIRQKGGDLTARYRNKSAAY